MVPLVADTGVTYKFRTKGLRAVTSSILLYGGDGISLNTRPKCTSERGFKEATVRAGPNRICSLVLCRLNTLSTLTYTGKLGLDRIGPRNTLCGTTTGGHRLTVRIIRTVGSFSSGLVLLTLSNSRVVGRTGDEKLGCTDRIFTSHTCRTSNSLHGEDLPNSVVRSRGRTVREIVGVVASNGIGTCANRRVRVRTRSIYIRNSNTGTLSFIGHLGRTFIGDKVRGTPLSRMVGWYFARRERQLVLALLAVVLGARRGEFHGTWDYFTLWERVLASATRLHLRTV